ncbi:MAG: hypothetical protein HFI76_14635 [Lachnospiraceae bacterium]|jgi:hypothetical protein|nr:hypothetical protein [Lachnospiraceae bacterium]
MEFQSMVHAVLWIAADGMGALWVLHTVTSLIADGKLADLLLLMANAICG